KGLHFDREERVHREFDGLASAVWAEMKKFFAHGTEDGARGFERCGFAANHENEFTFFRAPSAASDRRVEEANSGRGGSRGDFAREAGRDSAGVNIDAALLQRGERGFFCAAPKDFF